MGGVDSQPNLDAIVSREHHVARSVIAWGRVVKRQVLVRNSSHVVPHKGSQKGESMGRGARKRGFRQEW